LALAAHRSAFGRQTGYIVDELTSLRTEKYFRERLGQETERGERYGAELSVFILEIDNLDEIEEEYGENAQREALRKLAHQIKNSFRLVDVACRFENDQFGVIYPNTPIEGALTAAQRFEKLVEDPFLTIGETEIPIAIDGGVASYPEDGEAPDEMIKQARLALYEAKQTEEPALVSSHEIESNDQSNPE
jgi:two-component system cell cycle response regulator